MQTKSQITELYISVCSTNVKQRLKTGVQYGKNPVCSAVATLEKH